MAEIDRLEVQIEAQATKANQQLDKLIGKLNNVSSSLSKVNASGLAGLANGVNRLATSMQAMNNVKTADFSRLTKNIEKLGGLNTANLNSTASAINMIGKAFNNLNGISDNAVQIGEAAKNISKLGNKSVTRAIENIPKLTSSLNDMMSQLSKAPRVSENLIRMTNAMSNLASQGSKVGSASRSVNRSLNNYTGISDKATKSTKGLASSLGVLYAKFWLVQRAANALWSSIKLSMNYMETLNYFEVTVNKIGTEAAGQWQEQGYDSAESYYNSFRERMTDLTSKMTGFQINKDGTTTELDIKNLGLDPNEILNYQATFAQMADSMGVLEDTALNVSSAFTMLGADWASLKNLDMSESMKKFASALAGEIEPVRGLGIDIQQTTLQAYALKYGITENVSEMNQAAKVQLRLLAILDQSKVAMGDMANTLQSPANQLRILKQNFASLSRIIGNMFLPMVSAVLPYINGLVIALRRLFTWLSGLMGIDISKLSTSIGDSSLDISGMGDSTKDVVDGLDDATKKAEELKNVTTGIDELNVVSKDNTSSSGSSTGQDTSSGGYGVLDDAISKALTDYQKLWDDAFSNMENKANGIADNIEIAFKKIYDIAEPTRTAVKSLWDEGLSLFGNFTWTALNDFWSDFLVPLGTWTLGEGLPRFLDITNDFLKDIDWEKINKSLDNYWKALEPFAEGVGQGLLDFYEDMTKIGANFINVIIPGGLQGLANALNDIDSDEARQIGYALGIVATSLALISAVKGADTVLTGVTKALPTLPALAGLVTLATIVAGIREDLDYISKHGKDAFQIKNKSKENGTNPWGTNPWSVYKEDVNKSSDDIYNTSKLSKILTPMFNWDATKAIWDEAKANFKKGGLYVIGGVFEGILAGVGLVLEPIGDFFVAIFDGFCAIFGIHSPATTMMPIGQYIVLGVLEGVKNTWTEFSTFVSGLPQKTIDAFGNIKDRFVEKGKDMITGIQEGWNDLSSGFSTWLYQKKESVHTNFGSYWNNFVSKGNDIINGIKYGWDNLSGSFSTWLEQKRKSVPETFGSYWNNFVNKGSDIINGIKQGWDSLSSGFANDLAGYRNNVVSWFGNLKDSFVEKGKQIMSGLEDGWNFSVRYSSTWLSGLANTVSSKVTGISSSFSNLGKEIMSGLEDGWDYAVKHSSKWLSDIPSKLFDLIGGLADIGKKLWDSLTSGFTGDSSSNNSISSSKSTPSSNSSFTISGYSGGGMPNYGEAFIAREKGPELVGRIGNKSAVVNNDQITTSISDAVVKAMADANMSSGSDDLLREQNELLRQILAKDTNVNINGRKLNDELENVKKSNGFSFSPA